MGLFESTINKINKKIDEKIDEKINEKLNQNTNEDIYEDMEEEIIEEDNIINEDNEIVDYQKMKTIISSKLETKICKIVKEIYKNGKLSLITGSGFFCDISSLNIKGLMTNNHLINQKFLDNENELEYIQEDENGKETEKKLNLKEKRIKCTDIELDFTFIEILDTDKISKFLEIDKFINSKNYEEEIVFSLNYPHGGKMKFSYGAYIKKKNNYFLYSIGTMPGSSGAPIMLINNSKNCRNT